MRTPSRLRLQPVAAALLALSMAVSTVGCKTQTAAGASPSQQAQAQQPLTAAEIQMREDKDRFNKTVIGGVITGAVTGAAIAGLGTLLMGGSSRQARNNAIAGAVVGGVVGGIDGYATAKKQQAGMNEVRAIQSAVRDIQQDNQRLESLIATSDVVLKEGNQRLAQIRSDVAAGRMNARQAEEARKREEANIAVLNQALTKARETRSQYAQAAPKIANDPNARRDLDAEIARTDRQIAQLERNISEYSRAIAVSRA